MVQLHKILWTCPWAKLWWLQGHYKSISSWASVHIYTMWTGLGMQEELCGTIESISENKEDLNTETLHTFRRDCSLYYQTSPERPSRTVFLTGSGTLQPGSPSRVLTIHQSLISTNGDFFSFQLCGKVWINCVFTSGSLSGEKMNTLLIPHRKISSKCIKDLNGKNKTMRLPSQAPKNYT